MLGLPEKYTDPYLHMRKKFMQSAWSPKQPLTLAQQAGEQYLGTSFHTLCLCSILLAQKHTGIDDIDYVGNIVNILKYVSAATASISLLTSKDATGCRFTIEGRQLKGELISLDDHAITKPLPSLNIADLRAKHDGEKIILNEQASTKSTCLLSRYVSWGKRRRALTDTINELSALFEEHPNAQNMDDLRNESSHPLFAID